MHKHAIISSIILVMIIPIIMITFCYAAGNSINWTYDELASIKDHPVIWFGIDLGFVPFDSEYYYHKRDANVSGIDDLEGFNVAVQCNSSHYSYLLYYPDIDLNFMILPKPL